MKRKKIKKDLSQSRITSQLRECKSILLDIKVTSTVNPEAMGVDNL